MSTHNICFYGEVTKIIFKCPSYLFHWLIAMKVSWLTKVDLYYFSAYFSGTDGCRLLTTDQHNEIRIYRSPSWHLDRTVLHPHRFFQHITPYKVLCQVLVKPIYAKGTLISLPLGLVHLSC